MKLTNYMRDAYVNAILADTPAIDLNAITDEVHKIAIDDALTRVPEAIRKLWASNETRPYVSSAMIGFNSRTFGYGFFGCYVPCANNLEDLSAKAKAKITALGEKAAQASAHREELRQKLRAAAYGCTTRKQLAELMPEFEKYLPANEATAARTQLAVVNVVADLVKAGWPKGGKKAVAK